MTGRELHQLIHSLDRREKSNFAKFTDSNSESNQGGKRPKYLVLFDQMIKQKVYDEEIVRGTLFRNAVKFYQTREKLLDKIIQSIIFYGNEKLSARSYILQALKLDANELAQKKLVAELNIAHNHKDHDYFHYLLSLREKIEVSYRIVLEIPDDLQEIGAAQIDYQHMLTLRGILRRLKQMLKSGKNVSAALGPGQFLHEVQGIPTPNPECRYLYNKIRCYIEIMRIDMEQAFHFQQLAVDELEQMGPLFLNPLLAKEYFFMVELSLKNGDPDLVQRIIFKFSQIEPENQKERDIKNDYWIQSGISAGETQANLQLIEGVMPLLMQNTPLFKPELLMLNLFLAAKVYFVHKEYKKALGVVKHIRSIKKCKWPELYWAVETLRYIIMDGLGNVDVLDSIARSAIRFSEAVDSELPKISSRYAQKMTRSLNNNERLKLLHEFLHLRKTKAGAPKEKIAMGLLDLTFWFQHKAKDISLLDAFLMSNQDSQASDAKMAN